MFQAERTSTGVLKQECLRNKKARDTGAKGAGRRDEGDKHSNPGPSASNPMSTMFHLHHEMGDMEQLEEV